MRRCSSSSETHRLRRLELPGNPAPGAKEDAVHSGPVHGAHAHQDGHRQEERQKADKRVLPKNAARRKNAFRAAGGPFCEAMGVQWHVATIYWNMAPHLQGAPAAAVRGLAPDESHFLQARAFLARWRARRKRPEAAAPAERVPKAIEPPPEILQHYRAFAWVIYEQRLAMLCLTGVAALCGLVWIVAIHVKDKPPVVIRSAGSLKEAAAAFYGAPEISYDQLAFFLHGCLPLLYSIDDGGHPLLPLAQGLVTPEIYRRADGRLRGAQGDVAANRVTQALTITGLSDVVADAKSARAAAYVRGYVTVTVGEGEVRFFPWRARVLLEANPVSRLNPYPFYLASLEEKTGAEALAWDKSHPSGDGAAPP
jgi:hypothetical protein